MRTIIGSALLALAVSACSRGSGDSGGRDGGARAGADRPVPVATAKVDRRDVPIWLDGLGTVIAYKTVTIRPQVEGRLEQVQFREGQGVRKGDVLAQIDPRPFVIQLHQAEGALARDQAQLGANRNTLRRFEQLLKDALISQADVDNQRALVGQFEGAVRIDEAQIETAKLNLAYARITSPIASVTGIRAVDPGNVVHLTDTNGIVTLTQLDPIAVLFTLPQDQLPQVAQAMQAGSPEVAVYSRDGSLELGRGKLEVVDNQINQTTATLRLKAVLDNPKRQLWPNQFVKARLLLTVRKDATVISVAALQRGPEGTFVYVVGGDQAQPRQVEIALQQGEDALIARGLQAGELVVVEGQNQLRPGSKVQARPAGEKPGAEKPGAGGEKPTGERPAAEPAGRSGGVHR